MAARRVSAPELQQFVVANVQSTGKVLGAGAYGSVEEAEIPGAEVAAKKLHSQLINLGSPEQVQKWVTGFVEECKLMSKLRHPNIVQFLGICYFPGSQLPALLMEKLQTSLDNLLETTPNIPLDLKLHLLTGTIQGVVYLHSQTPPIVHRDLSARNVLIDSNFNAKIADLGVARMVNIQPGQLAATMTRAPGANLYMPPEAVHEVAARYNASIDIFSFGVISLFTLTQTFPKDLKPPTYRDPKTRMLVARTEIDRREEYVQQMKASLGNSHSLVNLTLDCLKYDQEDRPSAMQVLRRLKEFRSSVPQNCTETKLELLHRVSVKEEEIVEKDTRISQLENETRVQKQQVEDLQTDNKRLSTLAQPSSEVQTASTKAGRSERVYKNYSKAELVELAKCAEETERYEEMKKCVFQLAKMKGISGNEERNLFSVAIKNVAGKHRSSLRVIAARETENLAMESIVSQCKGEIAKDLTDLCGEVLEVLDQYILPNLKSTDYESRVFFLKMKGDYYRFLAECDILMKGTRKDSTGNAANSEKAYLEATGIARFKLASTDPIRLGLALNFSVYCYEIANKPEEACHRAKMAHANAIAELDFLDEDSQSYEDSTLIMQLLRDNLTLWTSDQTDSN